MSFSKSISLNWKLSSCQQWTILNFCPVCHHYFENYQTSFIKWGLREKGFPNHQLWSKLLSCFCKFHPKFLEHAYFFLHIILVCSLCLKALWDQNIIRSIKFMWEVFFMCKHHCMYGVHTPQLSLKMEFANTPSCAVICILITEFLLWDFL